jgi:hypothetical protein
VVIRSQKKGGVEWQGDVRISILAGAFPSCTTWPEDLKSSTVN